MSPEVLGVLSDLLALAEQLAPHILDDLKALIVRLNSSDDSAALQEIQDPMELKGSVDQYIDQLLKDYPSGSK